MGNKLALLANEKLIFHNPLRRTLLNEYSTTCTTTTTTTSCVTHWFVLHFSQKKVHYTSSSRSSIARRPKVGCGVILERRTCVCVCM